MSHLLEVNEGDFEKQVIEADTPVLVDFWAPWCGPCRMLTPVLESLSAKLNGQVRFVKLNTDESFSLAKKYGIMAIPTLIVFSGGRETQRLTGFLPENELEAWVRQALAAGTKAC
ncbi:MAG: thioredoxin [Candidatus Aminicenantes bacterium]|nr:thioredoxin [Candidatus Aminicenantes bacterium]